MDVGNGTKNGPNEDNKTSSNSNERQYCSAFGKGDTLSLELRGIGLKEVIAWEDQN